MSSLTFEKMHIPGSHLGPDSAYPILYKQKMFEKTSILDESEGLYINYGNILHMLPYTSQDDYDRSETEQVFDVAVLENRFLKATFVPALGGRMWSLYDKVNRRDLIINNPVFRPCNFAVRNAWFSGGVEWNCGVRGHSALTCSPIFAASYALDDGTPVLRLYAFERIRANTFQMDFFLKDDVPFLFARMRLVNGSTEVKPVYWWSTIAVKQEEGARVIVPADEAYINQDEDPVYKLPIPMVDGIDLSYPTNHTIVVDHFYRIPEGQRKYEAYVRADGKGIHPPSEGPENVCLGHLCGRRQLAEVPHRRHRLRPALLGDSGRTGSHPEREPPHAPADRLGMAGGLRRGGLLSRARPRPLAGEQTGRTAVAGRRTP